MISLSQMLETVRPLLPDSAATWGLRKFFNQRYPSIGQMTNLQIDRTNKKVSLDLELKGETQPLHITIERYEVSSAGGKTFVEIKEFHTSREWLSFLAESYVKGKKFEVPDIVKALL